MGKARPLNYTLVSTILWYSTILLYSFEYILTFVNMEANHNHGACKAEMILPVRDALDVLGGKWKIPIIGALFFGDKRFSEISKDIPGITDRMLSKELRDLEMNHLVKRTVHDTFPVTVVYSITEYGESLKEVIESLRNWGINHRQVIKDEFSSSEK